MANYFSQGAGANYGPLGNIGKSQTTGGYYPNNVGYTSYINGAPLGEVSGNAGIRPYNPAISGTAATPYQTPVYSNTMGGGSGNVSSSGASTASSAGYGRYGNTITPATTTSTASGGDLASFFGGNMKASTPSSSGSYVLPGSGSAWSPSTASPGGNASWDPQGTALSMYRQPGYAGSTTANPTTTTTSSSSGIDANDLTGYYASRTGGSSVGSTLAGLTGNVLPSMYATWPNPNVKLDLSNYAQNRGNVLAGVYGAEGGATNTGNNPYQVMGGTLTDINARGGNVQTVGRGATAQPSSATQSQKAAQNQLDWLGTKYPYSAQVLSGYNQGAGNVNPSYSPGNSSTPYKSNTATGVNKTPQQYLSGDPRYGYSGANTALVNAGASSQFQNAVAGPSIWGRGH